MAPLAINVDGLAQSGRGQHLYTASITMVVISGVVITARIAARISKGALELGWDDYSVVAGLGFAIIMSATECAAVTHGYGHHSKDLTHQQELESLKWFYISQIIYKMVITLAKVTVLLFYLRLFPDQKFRFLTFVGITIIALSGVTFSLASTFQCTPIPYFWDKTIEDSYCRPNARYWISYSSVNIATYLYVIILPIPLIWSLSLSKRNKWSLIGVFTIGCLAVIATIVRMTQLASSTGGDDTYDPIPVSLMSVIEANLSLVCACLPMFKQHLDKAIRFFGGSGVTTGENIPHHPYSHKLEHVKMGSNRRISRAGEQWSVVDNRITGEGRMEGGRSESQENIVRGKGKEGFKIYKNVEFKVERDSASERKEKRSVVV